VAGRFSVEAVFKAVDRVTAPVTRMQNRVGKFSRGMEKNFRKLNRLTNSFARGMKKAAAVTALSFAVIGGAMANVVGAGSDFEQAIVNVGAVSLKSRDQIAELEKQALDLGRSTKFTATQAANAMEVLARAGFNSQEILAATPAVLSAAAASGLEIAEVANHVSNVLKGMGLETTEAARVADVLALASARTNSSIGSLGESMKNVASTAKQLGVPLESAVAAVALLQDVGLDASVAGSALNTMLTKMAAPTDSIAKKMKKFGVSFKDAKGDMLPFQDVIEQLNVASKKAGGNFDKVAFLAELVGLRGQKAAANLADLFEAGKLQNLTAELDGALGKAQEMAKLRMNTFQGSMLLLGSAVDAVKVKLFGLESGPLKGAVDKLTEWVSANEDLIASRVGGFLTMIIDNFALIVTWAKRIAIGFAAFAAFSIVLKTMIAVMTLFNLVMAANPITLIVLAVIALIAGFVALVVWIDDVVAGFDKLPGIVKFALTPIYLLIKAIKFLKDNAGVIGGIASAAAGFFGFGGDDVGEQSAQAASAAAGVVSPQERAARSIEENRTTSTSEVTLRAESGTSAEVTGGALGGGVTLAPSGAF